MLCTVGDNVWMVVCSSCPAADCVDTHQRNEAPSRAVRLAHIALEAVGLLPRGLGHATLADLRQQCRQTGLPAPLRVLPAYTASTQKTCLHSMHA